MTNYLECFRRGFFFYFAVRDAPRLDFWWKGNGVSYEIKDSAVAVSVFKLPTELSINVFLILLFVVTFFTKQREEHDDLIFFGRKFMTSHL